MDHVISVMTSVCPTHVAGVLPLGGDPLAAAVSHLLPDFLLLHPADSSQDAPGRLAAAGTTPTNQKHNTLTFVPEIFS